MITNPGREAFSIVGVDDDENEEKLEVTLISPSVLFFRFTRLSRLSLPPSSCILWHAKKDSLLHMSVPLIILVYMDYLLNLLHFIKRSIHVVAGR